MDERFFSILKNQKCVIHTRLVSNAWAWSDVKSPEEKVNCTHENTLKGTIRSQQSERGRNRIEHSAVFRRLK